MFIYCPKYTETRKSQLILLNFLSGTAKLSIWKSRKNKLSGQGSLDVLNIFKGLVAARLRIEHAYYKKIKCMETFMYIWGLNEVLCTVDEEDDLMLAFFNILLVEFDRILLIKTSRLVEKILLFFGEMVMLRNLIGLIKVYFKFKKNSLSHTNTHSLSHTHTHTLSLSLSLSLTQTQTHTHSLSQFQFQFNFNLSVLYWHDKNYTFVLPKQLQLGCSQVVHI